jgi:hypothetical protein
MHNDVSIINYYPAVPGFPLFAALLMMLGANSLERAVCERVQHAIAGACAKHEVVREGGDVFDVQQQDVFAFFVFEHINYGMSKFEWVQESPHNGSLGRLRSGGAALDTDCIRILAFAERRRIQPCVDRSLRAQFTLKQVHCI